MQGRRAHPSSDHLEEGNNQRNDLRPKLQEQRIRTRQEMAMTGYAVLLEIENMKRILRS